MNDNVVALNDNRPALDKPRFPKALAATFLLMFVVGIPGLIDRVLHEHVNTAGNDFVPWGLWVAVYIFFSGISAGAFPIATLSFVFGKKRYRPLAATALLVSLMALAAAMIFVLIDLGRPERALHVFLGANPASVMTYEIICYTLFGPIVLAMLYMVLRPQWAKQAKKAEGLKAKLLRLLALGYELSEEQEQKDERILKVLGIIGLVVALALGALVGSLFAVLGARPVWHSGVFPITFLVSAFISGSALVLAVASLMGHGGLAYRKTLLSLARAIGIMLIVSLIILPCEALVVFKGGVPAHTAILKAIATGPYAWVFWVLHLGLGTLAAIAMLMLPKRPNLSVASVASLYVLIGVFAFRLNFVIPQLAQPGDYYVPNLVEWNSTIFITGLVGLMFLAAYRLLPIFAASTPIEFELAARRAEKKLSVVSKLLRPAA